MKVKKVMTTTLFTAAALVLLGSCSMVYNTGIDDDILDLSALSVGLDATLRYIAERDPALVEDEARTVQPGETYDYDGGSMFIENTPETMYNSLPGPETKRTVPASQKYLENFYDNPSYTAQFTIEPSGDDHYLIKLKVYDAASYILDYVYEEYYVTKDSWTALQDKDGTEGFRDYYDKMENGKTISHTLTETGSDGPYNITAPEVDENIGFYTFTIRDDYFEPTLFEAETQIDAPALQNAGGFYSIKQSTGNFSDYEAKTYYSESSDNTARNMAVFSLQTVSSSDSRDIGAADFQEPEYRKPNKNSNYIRTVSRKVTEYSGGELVSSLENSLNTYSYRDSNPWQHVVKTVRLEDEDNDNRLEITQTEDIYYSNSEVNGDPDKRTLMQLERTTETGAAFSGTTEISWKNSSWVNRYSTEFTGSKFKNKYIGGYNSRGIDTDGSARDTLEVDLEQLKNGEAITLILYSGAKFTGTYLNGRLTGILYYPNGDMKRIEIIEGVVFLNGELWEPGFQA